MSQRIFVTGASGRIGRPLVRYLVGQGHSVAALCRNSQDENALKELQPPKWFSSWNT